MEMLPFPTFSTLENLNLYFVVRCLVQQHNLLHHYFSILKRHISVPQYFSLFIPIFFYFNAHYLHSYYVHCNIAI